MADAEEIDQVLDSLTKESAATRDISKTLSPKELSCLHAAFLSSQPAQRRSKAFLALSAFCQQVRTNKSAPKGDQESVAEYLARIFSPVITSGLIGTNEQDILASISFLTALFQVDWEVASLVFQQNDTVTSLMDAVDICPSKEVAVEVAHGFAQACGHKPCRAIIPEECIQWLKASSSKTNDPALRAAAAVALVKLSKGALSDSQEAEPVVNSDEQEELLNSMKGMAVSGADQSSLADAIEGLVYLSSEPSLKETLSKDSVFLKELFSYLPRRQDASKKFGSDMPSAIFYGIVVIILNICSYRPRLTEEETQMQKLRKMANSGKPDARENPLEDDEHVRERGRRLIQAGAVGVLSTVIRIADSKGIRAAVGRAFLNLVEDKENRGNVLQGGGAKALIVIIRACMSEASSGRSQSAEGPVLEASDLLPIQALAKLAITAAPFQVFGPGNEVLYDAIRPFNIMLRHPSSNLLQQFEALMALTNLSSQSPEVASRIALADGLMNKVEFLLLDEHNLVRRAAMELICNLVAGSDEVFNKYSESKSKLQVLVALADVDDLPTRLAASGTLAQITASPAACNKLLKLQTERHRVLHIFAQLIDPSVVPLEEGEEALQADAGLVHRGVVCIRNFLVSVEAQAVQKELSSDAVQAGLPQALLGVAKQYANTNNAAVLRPTAESLKVLLDSGMRII